MPADTLSILQVIRFKGRATAQEVAAATEIAPATAEAEVHELVEAGHLSLTGNLFRITASGRAHLKGLLSAERGRVDQAAIAEIYEDFHDYNTALKQLAYDWQQRGSSPNDHTDPVYDNAVLARLAELHAAFSPLLERMVAAVGRLDPYPRRFATALQRVLGGDDAYFLRPVIDSYHTIWFELHEELIGLLGRSREDEARAGRAD